MINVFMRPYTLTYYYSALQLLKETQYSKMIMFFSDYELKVLG